MSTKNHLKQKTSSIFSKIGATTDRKVSTNSRRTKKTTELFLRYLMGKNAVNFLLGIVYCLKLYFCVIVQLKR